MTDPWPGTAGGCPPPGRAAGRRRLVPAGGHQPVATTFGYRHAHLRGRRHRPGTCSPATPATSRSGTRCSSAPAPTPSAICGLAPAPDRRRGVRTCCRWPALAAAVDRGPVRPGRAAGAAAHVRGRHDRDLLHLPADGVQPGLHRAAPAACRRAVPAMGSAATYNNPFYYAAPDHRGAAIGLSWLIRRSRFGLQLRAIRDDEDRARGLGVRAMRIKLAAFVISGFVTGVVGGLWFYFIGQALPEYGVRSHLRPDRGADGVPRRVRHRWPGRCWARSSWNRCSSS